ncbi:hypothetical protein VTK73DRAFT_6763 [Phialemonium thermophilum]|uniref:Bys1 family protein n=1 Tax=Phialemonium thermophilum TaxID=223376 RepID=A0ABR3WHR9_9PEZI
MYAPLAFLATLLLSTAASAAPAATVGQARVVNNCAFDVSVWSVGSQVSDPHRLAAHGGSYAETFSRDPQTGGRVLKVTVPADGLWTGAPQTDFAYNLDGTQVWYDLSDVFGDPFAGHRLRVASAEGSCPAIDWASGTPPAGSQVKVCTSTKDVTLTLCA